MMSTSEVEGIVVAVDRAICGEPVLTIQIGELDFKDLKIKPDDFVIIKYKG